MYAYDENYREKRKVAEKLVEQVFEGKGSGSLSNQILSELFYVLTEKIERPLSKEVAAKIVRKYALSDKWEKVNYTIATTSKAAFNCSNYNGSFWDVLIAETMKENEITQIITENGRDFSGIPGIKVINPFKSV